MYKRGFEPLTLMKFDVLDILLKSRMLIAINDGAFTRKLLNPAITYDDGFLSAINMETIFENKGIKEGRGRGMSIGEADGAHIGLSRGFDIAVEAAFYWGMCSVWLATLTRLPVKIKFLLSR